MLSKITCTVCPQGCEITVNELNVGNYDIAGYSCERGMKYAQQEIKNPMRILTTTIKINNGFIKRLPVRSKDPIPKDIILQLMSKIKAIEIEAPVEEGEVIMENILGTGTNIIASKSILKDNNNEPRVY